MNRLPAAGIVARAAGLATAAVLLWAFAPASGKMAETQTVAIRIRYSRFIPAHITVRPGTTYTFSRPGLLLIGCHAPGHYAYGMKGWVQVR